MKKKILATSIDPTSDTPDPHVPHPHNPQKEAARTLFTYALRCGASETIALGLIAQLLNHSPGKMPVQ